MIRVSSPTFFLLSLLSTSLYLAWADVSLVLAQQGKPILHRRADPEDERPAVFDPNLAEKHVSVGNFYFKRQNYAAATDRYRLALKYNPKLVVAYEKLARSLERQGEILEAISICQTFLDMNPDKPEAQRFKQLIRDLSAKVES